jgi:hypothetical protein
MANRGGVAVYVTSHGFGHLNRVVAPINHLPLDIPVIIRCQAELFGRWHERLERPAKLEAGVWDSGALNPPGDSAATDGAATIAQARRVFAEALTRVVAEAKKLRDEGTAAVLCDAPCLPLVAARRAGVPGYLLANFSWAEIYEPHARKVGGDARRFVAEVRAAYRHATAVFRAEPALPMKEIREQIPVGMVVNPGRERRQELRETLGLGADTKCVYFYIGRYGQAGLAWDRLAALERIHFVGFHPAPVGPLPNLHVISPEKWTGGDLAASSDAVVAKAGYGTVCEAMAARTPIVYPPRSGFAEHRALDRALRAWGGGIPAASRVFTEFRLAPLLERAFSIRPGPPPFPTDGAARVAEHLARVCRRA